MCASIPQRVHRAALTALRRTRRPDSIEQFLLTKGDNNQGDDVGLYNGVQHLKRTHIVGKVQGCDRRLRELAG